jgi:hypothetical protein
MNTDPKPWNLVFAELEVGHHETQIQLTAITAPDFKIWTPEFTETHIWAKSNFPRSEY